MKRVLFFSVLCLTLNACSDDSTPEVEDTTVEQETITLSVVKENINVGLYPNRILQDGKSLYVVNSGDNTIGKLNLSDYSYDNNFITLDQNTNPYSFSIKDGHLYISSSGKLSETFTPDDIIVDVDLSTGNKTTVLSSLYMASDIITSKCVEFVESEYDYSNSVASGKFTQYCNESKTTVSTTCKNPTRVVARDDGYIVTCSGIYTYDDNYSIVGTDGSGVCFYTSQITEDTCILANKDTGAPSVGKTTSIIGATYSGKMQILVDKQTEEVELSNGTMLVPVHLKDDVYAIAAFNTNIIYIYDANNKKVLTEYKLSKTDLDKRGPLDIVYLQSDNKLAILNSLSSTVDILSITEK